MSEPALVVALGGAALAIVSATIALFLDRKHSRVTLKANGKIETFEVTPDQVSKVRKIIEEDRKLHETLPSSTATT
jgi:hypothetical protein